MARPPDKFTQKQYHRADVLLGKCGTAPTLVEAVQFHGVRVTKNDALVKEVAELYKARNLDELIHNSNLAAKHFQEVGLMEKATALIDTAPSSTGYVVNFVVKEPKPFTLGVRAGISTQGDADVILNAGRHSFGGRGEALDASYSYTVKGDHSFNVTASKPQLGWQRYAGVAASVFRSMAYLPWNQSNVEENGITLQYSGQLWARRLLHTLKMNAIWRTLKATDESAFSVREHAGHTLKFSLENVIALDTRDRPILAKKGLLVKLAQEYAGPFGDSSFVRHQIDLQLHLLDRVYLGGGQDLRGFALNTIGVRADNSCIGAGTTLAGALHLYRPLFPPNMLFAHAFIASGSVASVRTRNRLQDLSDTQRLSAGLGLIFVFRDIFRLEINYTQPLKFAPGDSQMRGLQFGAGINFI